MNVDNSNNNNNVDNRRNVHLSSFSSSHAPANSSSSNRPSHMAQYAPTSYREYSDHSDHNPYPNPQRPMMEPGRAYSMSSQQSRSSGYIYDQVPNYNTNNTSNNNSNNNNNRSMRASPNNNGSSDSKRNVQRSQRDYNEMSRASLHEFRVQDVVNANTPSSLSSRSYNQLQDMYSPYSQDLNEQQRYGDCQRDPGLFSRPEAQVSSSSTYSRPSLRDNLDFTRSRSNSFQQQQQRSQQEEDQQGYNYSNRGSFWL